MQDPRLDRGKQLGGIHRVVRFRHLPMRLEQLLRLLFDPDGFDRLLEQFDRGAVLLGRAVELLCVLQWRQAGEVDDDIVCQLWRRLGGRTRGIRLGTGIRKAVGIVRHREIPFREFGGLTIVVEPCAFALDSDSMIPATILLNVERPGQASRCQYERPPRPTIRGRGWRSEPRCRNVSRREESYCARVRAWLCLPSFNAFNLPRFGGAFFCCLEVMLSALTVAAPLVA